MRVLAIGCHPDDLEICCFGTLRKYVEQGADVYACHVSNGNQGHPLISPEELAKIRADEAARAGEIIGIKEVFHLDAPDMYANYYDERILNELADIICLVRPDVLITHNDDDYHPDHIEVSKLVSKAAFLSGLPHRKTKYQMYQSFIPTFYMDTLAGVAFNPTHYVDISNQIELKLEALAKHQTQVKWMAEHDKIDFIDMVRTCSKYRGFQCGVDYAEGFRPHDVYQRHSTKHLLP